MAGGVEISKRLVLVNAASTVVRRLLSITVLFWMHRYLIQRIPVEEYALLPVLMAVIAFTPLLTTVLAGGLGRYVTEAYARHDERRVTEIVSSMAPLLWAAASLLAIGGAVFTLHIDAVLTIEPAQLANARTMFSILLAGAVLRVAVAPFTLGYYVRQKLVQRDLLGLGGELLRIGLLLYLLTQHEARVVWVVVASFVAGLVETLVVLRGSRRLMPALCFRPGRMRRAAIRPVLSYGSWTILGQLSTVIREMADPILLNKLASPSDVASFHMGAQIDRQVRRTMFSATSVAQQATTAMAATGQDDRLRRLWYRLSRLGLWALLATAVPLVVFREQFFAVYLGAALEKAPQAPLVLALLVARYVVIWPNAGTGMLAMARAEMRPAALRAAGLELTNLALTLVLVGGLQLGAAGAALATAVVAFAGHPLLLWTLGLRLSGGRPGEWFRVAALPGLVPALCALPVWLALVTWGGNDTWTGLATSAALGWAVYAGALWKVMRPEDRNDFASLLARIRLGGPKRP